MGEKTEGFVFLNHCLDVVEAIEEGGDVDHTDLESTDFPQDVPLPSSPHLSPQELDEIKEWVLAVSVDQSIEMVTFDMNLSLKCFFGRG